MNSIADKIEKGEYEIVVMMEEEREMAKEITIRAKAFTGQGVQTHRVLVSDDSIRVWDSVAGHYTRCHTLSASAVKRAKKSARLVV